MATETDAAYLAGVLDTSHLALRQDENAMRVTLHCRDDDILDYLALTWGGERDGDSWFIPNELAPSITGSARKFMLTDRLA